MVKKRYCHHKLRVSLFLTSYLSCFLISNYETSKLKDGIQIVR